MSDRIDVLGVAFDDVTVSQAVSHAYDMILRRDEEEKTYVVTPNPEIVWLTRHNDTLREAINGAGLTLPDGIGIILGARILGTPIRGGRVPGIDFISAMFERMSESGGSAFLLGAKPGIAEEAGKRLVEKYPGLIVAGTADGYFTDDEEVVNKINAVSPDLLLVCMGAPAQELWMASNIDRINVKLCAGLGGALDVFAGKAKRAPVIFRKIGLEWLYRIIREPRRIKRSLKLPLFVFAVIWKRIRGK